MGISNIIYKRIRNNLVFSGATAIALAAFPGCSPVNAPQNQKTPDAAVLKDFPDFITRADDYFTTRIGSVPAVNPDSFRLEITGLVRTPRSYSLSELRALPQVTLPLTVECIGNGTNGDEVGTAVWKGFNLYDLLASLGIESGATGVKYRCADGYYASHTMDQIKNGGVFGALYMNGDTLPPVQGYPLRLLLPGYYGAKQPMWVVAIEVSNRPIADYWGDRGWDVSPPIPVTSRIFFPFAGTTYTVGDTVGVGGAAWGGRRVAKVEVTTDGGASWRAADIVESMDADNVWVFWLAHLAVSDTGIMDVRARATDTRGLSQPKNDTSSLDGSNGWPEVVLSAIPKRSS
jgi:DMSO/TMAO reductase YedYZ molybdopterin-dependent catalytic subunit